MGKWPITEMIFHQENFFFHFDDCLSDFVPCVFQCVDPVEKHRHVSNRKGKSSGLDLSLGGCAVIRGGYHCVTWLLRSTCCRHVILVWQPDSLTRTKCRHGPRARFGLGFFSSFPLNLSLFLHPLFTTLCFAGRFSANATVFYFRLFNNIFRGARLAYPCPLKIHTTIDTGPVMPI